MPRRVPRAIKHGVSANQHLPPSFAPAHKSLGRFWIGLAFIAAIGLMGLSAWRQGWFTPTEHLFLVLDNGTEGVQVGTLVKLKGFRIGEVDDMTLEPDLNVRVRMRVTRNKLGLLDADAKAKLSRDTPIGAKYIEILPGTKPKGTLLAEAIVPLNESSDVEDIILTVKNGVEKLTVALDKIGPILDDTKKLTGEAADMRKTIHSSVTVVLSNLQALTTTITKDVPQITDKVNQALDDVKKLTASAATDIPPAIRSTRVVTEEVAEITDGAKKTWPISSFVKEDAPIKPLPLDAFEAKE